MNQYLYPMENPIQNYAWGSRTALAGLQGRADPVVQPEAELWMGAHPKAPSKVRIGGAWAALPTVLAQNPGAFLGGGAAASAGSLPYLFKVLAAAEPLSIQAHPSQSQAREGFAREDRQGIPRDAPQRNYRDPNHKPELICALAPFWALCGFRPAAEIRALFNRLCPLALGDELRQLEHCKPDDFLRQFFALLMELAPDRRRAVTGEALANARDLMDESEQYRWITILNEKYPGDIGILAPAFLNCLCLEPGQALFLPAGELHAYLDGTAIEIMANSDNVLRGGLTPKHVDVPELLQVLNFRSRTPQVLTPRALAGGEARYPTWADEFQLSVIELDGHREYSGNSPVSAEILLAVSGRAEIRIPETGEALTLDQGRSVLIPAIAPEYRISGPACLYKAAVPRPADVLKEKG